MASLVGDVVSEIVSFFDSATSSDLDSILAVSLVSRSWRQAVVLCDDLWDTLQDEGIPYSYSPTLPFPATTTLTATGCLRPFLNLLRERLSAQPRWREELFAMNSGPNFRAGSVSEIPISQALQMGVKACDGGESSSASSRRDVLSQLQKTCLLPLLFDPRKNLTFGLEGTDFGSDRLVTLTLSLLQRIDPEVNTVQGLLLVPTNDKVQSVRSIVNTVAQHYFSPPTFILLEHDMTTRSNRSLFEGVCYLSRSLDVDALLLSVNALLKGYRPRLLVTTPVALLSLIENDIKQQHKDTGTERAGLFHQLVSQLKMIVYDELDDMVARRPDLHLLLSELENCRGEGATTASPTKVFVCDDFERLGKLIRQSRCEQEFQVLSSQLGDLLPPLDAFKFSVDGGDGAGLSLPTLTTTHCPFWLLQPYKAKELSMEHVKSFYAAAEEDYKAETILDLVEVLPTPRYIIFTTSNQRAREVSKTFQTAPTGAISHRLWTEDLSLQDQAKALSAFCQGDTKILVATDHAMRMDSEAEVRNRKRKIRQQRKRQEGNRFSKFYHQATSGGGGDSQLEEKILRCLEFIRAQCIVVNYDFPRSTTTYFERATRFPGRYPGGQKSKFVIDFVTPAEVRFLRAVEKDLQVQIDELPMDFVEMMT